MIFGFDLILLILGREIYASHAGLLLTGTKTGNRQSRSHTLPRSFRRGFIDATI